MTPRERFEEIADRLLAEPGVEEKTGFGSTPGLRVDGRIFTMLDSNRLVLKLPAGRCRALLGTSGISPFDRGQSRPLKEWIAVGPERSDWCELADEALRFVRSLPRDQRMGPGISGR